MNSDGARTRAADVVIVSLGSTPGLRRADQELSDSLARAGAEVAMVQARAARQLPTLALTDLAWALAARRAALTARAAGAVIYSSTTAALLWPRPGAIRFDATAAGNRPGRHGLWQRPLERRRLGQAPLLLPWSGDGLGEAPPSARAGDRALVLPVPIEPSRCAAAEEATLAPRDIAALTYGANPLKKGLDRVLVAWRGARALSPAASAGELLIAGASARELAAAGIDLRGHEGVRALGALEAGEYRALLRRARVFVCAPRREDFGIAQLEALADGCMLVSTTAPGPYAALPIARALDPRLIGTDLAGALHTALEQPSPGYDARAREALAPFTRQAVDRVVARQLLPRLFT